MVDNDAPWSRTLTLGALMVYPGHFFPVAFREATERFVVFADAIGIDEPCGSLLHDLVALFADPWLRRAADEGEA